MKNIFVIIAVFLFTGTGAQVTKANLQAGGLTCSMCSKAVYKALSAIPFVEKVKPDIQGSAYEINFKPGSTVDLDQLSKAVVNAGFSVAMLKVTVHFTDTKVQNDTHVELNTQNFHFLDVSPQILQGDKILTLIDRNFVTAKTYKKYGKFTTMKCYETGVMGSCCKNPGAGYTTGARVYHVTI